MDLVRASLLTTASLADQKDFRIGKVEVSPATRVISGPGGTVQVEPRVMQVLVVLCETPGSVVTRDTLLDRCWGGVFVGDDSLNRAISGVRRAAATVGDGSFRIETVPRTGYRLVELQVPPDGAANAPRGASFDRRRALIGTAGVLATGLVGATLWPTLSSSAGEVQALMQRSEFAMRSGSIDGGRRSIEMLQRAVQIAPRNAAAWGRLALAYAKVDEHAIDQTQWPAARLTAAAQRALELDPDNIDAQAALVIGTPYYGDWLAAERRFDAILAKDPGHLATRDSRMFLLGAVGRMIESGTDRLALADLSLQDANLMYRQVYSYWFLGRIDDADRWAARGLEMWPGNAGLWFGKLWVLSGTGRFARAIRHIDDVAARPQLPPPLFEQLRRGMQAADGGTPAQREMAAAAVLGQVGQSVTAVVNAMMMLHLLGDTDRAFALAHAYFLEDGPIIAQMEWRPGQPVVPDQRRRKSNILFVPTATAMQRDPRFATLTARMGLREYWMKRGVSPDYQRQDLR